MHIARILALLFVVGAVLVLVFRGGEEREITREAPLATADSIDRDPPDATGTLADGRGNDRSSTAPLEEVHSSQETSSGPTLSSANLAEWMAIHQPFSASEGFQHLGAIVETEALQHGLLVEDANTLAAIVAGAPRDIAESVETIRCVPSVCEIVYHAEGASACYEILNVLVREFERNEVPFVSWNSWWLEPSPQLHAIYLMREPIIDHLRD